jgi:hypothetical protein
MVEKYQNNCYAPITHNFNLFIGNILNSFFYFLCFLSYRHYDILKVIIFITDSNLLSEIFENFNFKLRVCSKDSASDD